MDLTSSGSSFVEDILSAYFCSHLGVSYSPLSGINIRNSRYRQAFSPNRFLWSTDSGIADMNQIAMIVLVPLFSSGVFGVEISPKDGEDLPASSEDQRTLLSIVWSCLATIFACTWLSVHPNVPGRNITTRGWIPCTIEHVKIMVCTILAPEVIVGWAAEQFIIAWKVCYRTDFSISSVINGWRGKKDKYSPNLTMAHGFVLSMGGFCYTEIESISPSPSPSPSSSSTTLSDHAALFRAVEPSILVLDDLDSPDLEKKLEEVSPQTIEDKSKGDALSKTFSILQVSWFIVQCAARAIQHLPITLLEMTALAFAGLSIITYCLWWNKPLNVKYHISLDGSDLMTFRWTPKITRTGFWDSIMEMFDDAPTHYGIGHGAIRFTSGNESSRHEGTQITRQVIIGGVALLFGAFHCIAWSFSFPSHTEMVLWKFSSLTVLITMSAAVILFLTVLVYGESVAVGVVFGVVICAYIVARIMLIVLAFMQLRSLPALALHTVQWTTYIPHI